MENEGCFAPRLAAHFFEVDIMDRQSDLDSQDAVFYPVPQAHWFPRPIAFRAYKPSWGKPQQDVGQKGGRRLHIRVSRPVRLTLTLN